MKVVDQTDSFWSDVLSYWWGINVRSSCSIVFSIEADGPGPISPKLLEGAHWEGAWKKSTGRAWDSCRFDSRYTHLSVTQNYWPPKMDGFKKMFQDSRLSITKSVIRLVLFFEAIAIWFLQQNHEFKVSFPSQEMEDALRNLPMPVVVNMASEEEPPGTERQVLLDRFGFSQVFFQLRMQSKHPIRMDVLEAQPSELGEAETSWVFGTCHQDKDFFSDEFLPANTRVIKVPPLCNFLISGNCTTHKHFSLDSSMVAGYDCESLWFQSWRVWCNFIMKPG